MSAIHHPNYRVIPGRTQGFWTGICKVCPSGTSPFLRGKSHMAEEAVVAHLLSEHNIEAKEATT